MSDLFENIALNDDTEVINHRKASAVATKRVKDRFGAFLANGQEDLPARLALVEDDIHEIVQDVAAEYGGDATKIEAAIKRSLNPNPAASGGLAAPGMGAPGAAGQVCQHGVPADQCPQCSPQAASGDTGAYMLNHTMPQVPTSGPMTASVEAAGGFCDTCHKWKSGPKAGCTCDGSDEPGKEGVTDIDGELDKAPSAVGGKSSNIHEAEALETVKLPTGDESGLGGPSPKIDKDKSGDNFGWSLEPIDTQMDGTPHPTTQQDPTDKADYVKKDFLDQTQAVTETQDLPANSDDAGFNTERNIEQYPTKTFGDNGTDPVTRESLSHQAALGDVFPDVHESLACPSCNKVLSPRDRLLGQGQCENCVQGLTSPNQGLADRLAPTSATDPDKNPIRSIIDEYDGFLMPNQVESALGDWEVG